MNSDDTWGLRNYRAVGAVTAGCVCLADVACDGWVYPQKAEMGVRQACRLRRDPPPDVIFAESPTRLPNRARSAA